MNEPTGAATALHLVTVTEPTQGAIAPHARDAMSRLTRRLSGADNPPDAHPESAAMRSAWRRRKPTPGWNARGTALSNPRPPAVPASLDLTLEEYYAAAATIGLLAAQDVEPDPEWASKWSLDYGKRMAREARRRRERQR